MVKQYDVYWVDLNPTIGAEMQKIRPCVIVSPKELNEHLDTVIIIPITSAIHGYPYRVRCHIMSRDGEIATDQIRTIDKRRLKNRIASLATDEISNLQDILHQMFCEQHVCMSNKEKQEFIEKLRRGLELAEKRMLQEKARNNEDVIVCGDDNVIRRIPTKQVIADNPIFQD